MRRARALIAIAAALAAIAASPLGCGGDDDGSTPTPAPSEAPGGAATPPGADGLPPGIAECLAEEGFELESSDDLHSVPEQVLQACFEALHQGGS